jgi:hypothetical protein
MLLHVTPNNRGPPHISKCDVWHLNFWRETCVFFADFLYHFMFNIKSRLFGELKWILFS